MLLEAMETQKIKKLTKKVPKGTSEYQAAWILDSDNDWSEDDEGSCSEDEEDDFKPMEDQSEVLATGTFVII